MTYDLRGRRVLLTIFYEGPWARLMNFCMGIRRDNTVRWEVPDSGARGWKRAMESVAMWAERRDHAWRERYAVRGVNPPDRWRRA